MFNPFKSVPKKDNNDTKPDSYSETKFKEWTMRWVDLEARVTALELADKEYKKRVRRSFAPENPDATDSNSSVIIPV